MRILLAAIFLVIATAGIAQNDKYVNAMKKNLAMFDSAKSTADFQALAASFERIGDAEKTEWLPYYYAGLALLAPGWQDANIDKDANAEKVKSICAKAEALAKDDGARSEILALRNMAATQQMLVDPQNRWMSYGQEAGTHLKKGQELNAANPRLAYLEAAGIFGTPEQFGGGKAKAKPLLEKAVALFQAEQPQALHPQWGKKEAEGMLALCQQP